MGKSAEWGKLNAGQRYNIVAIDLDRAFACCRLKDYEGPILEHVRELSWGLAIVAKKGRGEPWPESRRCKLDLSDLAKRTGFTRQRLSAAKAALIKSKILVEHVDGTVSINKSADEWIFPATGHPRLTAKLVAYAVEMQPKSQRKLDLQEPQTERASVHPEAVQGERASVHPEGQGERASVQGVNAPAFSAERASVQGVNAPAFSAIEDRPRGDFKKSFKSFFLEGEQKNGEPSPRDEEEDQFDYMASALKSHTNGTNQ